MIFLKKEKKKEREREKRKRTFSGCSFDELS